MAARWPSGSDFGAHARHCVGVRYLFCRHHSCELEIPFCHTHRFLNRDYIMFDCGGMAFSETDFHASVAIERSEDSTAPSTHLLGLRGNVMTKRTIALLCFVCLGTLGAVALPSHRSLSTPADVRELNVTIQEWAVPTKGAHPHDPAVGADGALWFTEQMVNKLGRLDPKTGEFKEYPLATDKNSGPHGLVADTEANIWITANFGGYIGKLDPRTGKVTEYQMPVEQADDPHKTVFDGHGIFWFTVQGRDMVSRLDL